MPSKTEIILPLHQFFEQLQQYEKQLKHKSLSTNNYLELVELLADGYGLISVDDLFFYCQKLWFRPHFSPVKFKSFFDNHLALFQSKDSGTTPNSSNASNEGTHSGTTKTGEDPPPKTGTETGTPDGSDKDDNEEPSSSTKNPLGTKKFETISLTFKPGRVADTDFIPTDIKELEKSIFQQAYRLQGQYFPVNKRKIQQSVRSLRIQSQKRDQQQIDWSGTIDRVANQGYFDQLVFQYISQISNKLCLLIDHGSDMVAFHELADEMAQVVRQYESKETPQVYYFNQCPVNYLYLDKAQTDAIPVKEFAKKNEFPIFVVSDAGAARGHFERERIDQSKEFLQHFSDKPIAWLNPMPRFRWQETSAAFIAELTSMFAINPKELGNAIKLFKQLK